MFSPSGTDYDRFYFCVSRHFHRFASLAKIEDYLHDARVRDQTSGELETWYKVWDGSVAADATPNSHRERCEEAARSGGERHFWLAPVCELVSRSGDFRSDAILR